MLTRNYVHLVFGTKDRRPWIKPSVQQTLWTYLTGIAREYGIDVLAIGGTDDQPRVPNIQYLRP